MNDIMRFFIEIFADNQSKEQKLYHNLIKVICYFASLILMYFMDMLDYI